MTPRALFTSSSAAAMLLAGAACAQDSGQTSGQPSGEPAVTASKEADFEPAFPNQTRAPAIQTEASLQQTEIASGLVHPWAVEAMPDGAGYLVTERPGRLRHITADGTVSDPIAGVPEVADRDQGGLLDVKVGPNFAQDRMVYLTYAKPVDGRYATAAARGVLSEDMTQLTQVEDIFVQEPASTVPKHYGSRIVFDGQGHAFVTTGEHSSMQTRVFAQDLDKTYGKVVRINLDGSTPSGNPFAGQDGAVDTIWSTGHRNIQGAAFAPDGELWIIEHGPRGGDELNLIEPGLNYGWPVVSYGIQYSGGPIGSGEADHAGNGFEEPRYYWDPVIAPGDMTFYQGDMFPEWQGDVLIGGLVSGSLVRLSLDGTTVTGEEYIAGDLGRTRDVEIDADGSLLVVTDYQDGSLIRLSNAARTN